MRFLIACLSLLICSQFSGSIYEPSMTAVRYTEQTGFTVTRLLTEEQITEVKAQGFQLECPNPPSVQPCRFVAP